MSPTVLITDCDMGPARAEKAILEPAGFSVVHEACRSEADVVAAVERTRAEGLLVQYAPITADVLRTCPTVRAVVRYGVGLDNVDVAAAGELGVDVSNVRDYGSDEVADHAMALLLSLLRGTPAWSHATAVGQWPIRGDVPDPRELRETTLGLLGFGAIARQVARRAHAFGMTVQAHDPFVDAEDVAAAAVRAVSFDELWATSGAVSLHLPLTDRTRNIVDAAALGRMPVGAFLVNTARAGLVDRGAFEAALLSGRLAGAGLDVWWQEPADPEDTLTRHPGVLLTPHIAWLSTGSVQRLRRSAAAILLESIGAHLQSKG